jgi:hypothetical protein
VLAAAAAGPAAAQTATQRLLEAKARQEGQGTAAQTSTGQSAPAASGQAAADTVVIEARGAASYYANDPARSRGEAIEAAQRDAVEQASGVFITSESTLRNFDLVSDEVLSRSKGFIRSYDVLKEGQDGPFYGVNIRAVVVKQAFIKDFEDALEELYRRKGKPRIMLVVQEFQATNGAAEGLVAGQGESPLSVVEKELRKILLRRGFTFVDARMLTRSSAAQKGGETSRAALLDSARTSKAELVMIGHGRISSQGKLQQFSVVEASVGLDVIRTDNGQVLASDVSLSRSLHINADTAMVLALQKAAEDIAPKIIEQVTYLWLAETNTGQRIEMVVRNASFGDLMVLRRALGNTVKGVRSVRQKSYGEGVALLELESRDAPDRLAESLHDASFDGFRLTIEDVSSNTLTVNMVKGK